MNERPDWTNLLVEPKAICGTYGAKGPSLSTFVLHAMEPGSDQIGIAGEFKDLPQTVPPGWILDGRAIAYVIFRFTDVKSKSVGGVFSRSTPLMLSLEETSELWATAPSGRSIYYKRFSGKGEGLKIEIVAAHIRAIAGQRAMKYDWAKLPSNTMLGSYGS